LNKKWKFKGCPRCHGDVIINQDEDGYYESCILCGYIKYFPTQKYKSGQKEGDKDEQ
jgi:ribosomal protein S27AE